MEIDIRARPAYAMAYVRLEVGETVHCESGAMVAMSAGIEAAGRATGGIGRSVMRKVLVQENFFLAQYTGQMHGAWVALSPRFPGDINLIEMCGGDDVVVESGSFLAHSAGVTVSAKLGNLQTVALREGATLVRAQGQGQLLVSSYGGIETFSLAAGERMIVDTGHLVAWNASMGLRVGPLSGIVAATLTGEGLVGELVGPGNIWIQTRAEDQLRSWLLPKRNQNSR